MRKFLGSVRRRAALAAVGGALLAAGVGFGAHAASAPTQTQPASDTAAVTSTDAAATTAATTSEAAPTTSASVVQQSSASDPGTATVGQVDTQPAPALDTQPSQQATDPSSPEPPPGSTVAPDGLTYGPMPSPTMEPMPGEPGYVSTESASQSPTG